VNQVLLDDTRLVELRDEATRRAQTAFLRGGGSTLFLPGDAGVTARGR